MTPKGGGISVTSVTIALFGLCEIGIRPNKQVMGALFPRLFNFYLLKTAICLAVSRG